MLRSCKKRSIILHCLILLLFLCSIPAVSYAAQPQGDPPQPTAPITVEPGTTVKDLYKFLPFDKNMQVTVLKPDGGTRLDGCLETGDLAVVSVQGKYLYRVKIIVSGASSNPPSSDSPVSSEGPSSAPVSSGGASSVPASSGGQQPQTESRVLEGPVPVGSLKDILASDGWENIARVTVTAPDGTDRETGLVCTGDTVRTLDQNGTVQRIVTVTVLGDLTRCGRITEGGCTELYKYLTGCAGLPQDILSAADVNRDGSVDTRDLLAMKKRLASSSGAENPGNGS